MVNHFGAEVLFDYSADVVGAENPRVQHYGASLKVFAMIAAPFDSIQSKFRPPQGHHNGEAQTCRLVWILGEKQVGQALHQSGGERILALVGQLRFAVRPD